MTRARAAASALRELARLYGIQTAYVDVFGRRRAADPDALRAVLRALGVPAESDAELADAVRERRASPFRRGLEPVLVAWDGGPCAATLWVPARHAGGLVRVELRVEGAGPVWLADARAEVAGAAVAEGERYAGLRVRLPDGLPMGVHRWAVELGDRRHESWCVAAPRRAYAPAARTWGVFLPLYALRSGRSLGVADLGDLRALRDWAASLGAGLVGTLPLLAAFLDEPCEPSPYAPASRLFWNELYLDLERVPEFHRLRAAGRRDRARDREPGARDSAEAAGADAGAALAALAAEGPALARAPEAHLRRAYALRRGILDACARLFFSEGAPDRRAAFDRYAAAHPRLDDYARFRAMGESRRAPWHAWPEPARSGALRDAELPRAAVDFHRYAQWCMDEQMRAFRDRAGGSGLYLDLPLGVHPDGYDTWRERALFVRGVSAGAPPDGFFTEGQDWGFPPLHPERCREEGYGYWRAALEHHLRCADALRVDHVMSWHRLFWVPHGFPAARGVYVRYPAEEWYAVAALASYRHRAWIVGEDLGTVPAEVRRAMAQHGIHRLFVLQYALRPDPADPLGRVPARALACVNTHDMPPFAAFWRGLDIEERAARGALDPAAARAEAEARARQRAALVHYLRAAAALAPGAEDDPVRVHAACLEMLGRSRARAVLVNLEDLWGEVAPQNVPGTTAADRPNWRRRARRGFEEFANDAHVLEPLRRLHRARTNTRSSRRGA
jgi:4-alpha-glucanotransferase